MTVVWMALLSCMSSAVVAGGGMLSLHSHFQVCVCAQHSYHRQMCYHDMYAGWCSALFHLQLLAIIPFLLTNESEYTVSFALPGEKSWSDCLSTVWNYLYVYTFIMGSGTRIHLIANRLFNNGSYLFIVILYIILSFAPLQFTTV